jgi:hypothetical protein
MLENSGNKDMMIAIADLFRSQCSVVRAQGVWSQLHGLACIQAREGQQDRSQTIHYFPCVLLCRTSQTLSCSSWSRASPAPPSSSSWQSSSSPPRLRTSVAGQAGAGRRGLRGRLLTTASARGAVAGNSGVRGAHSPTSASGM